MIDKYVLRRILLKDKLKRIFMERLTEPLHLNVISAAVAIFGTFRAKVAFDLVVRQQYAFSILYAAEHAKECGYSGITIIEFGVASGAGMMNMCNIAKRVARSTGINIVVVGFDTGAGLPEPVDYRDYPDMYRGGDFPMNADSLRGALFRFCSKTNDDVRSILRIGDIKDTAKRFINDLRDDHPIGFISVDVDYYSSARHCLDVLWGPASKYLPRVIVYLDDIGDDSCSPWTGEMLAVKEFNKQPHVRKIAPFPMLRSKRVFRNARWIDQIFVAHIHDHALRSVDHVRGGKRVIENEYLTESV